MCSLVSHITVRRFRISIASTKVQLTGMMIGRISEDFMSRIIGEVNIHANIVSFIIGFIIRLLFRGKRERKIVARDM